MFMLNCILSNKVDGVIMVIWVVFGGLNLEGG